jgi:hypothetical protein
MMFGCAALQNQSKPYEKPQLDSSLAKDCVIPDAPTSKDYDVWQTWVEEQVLAALGDCAIRHKKTVEAWPK